MSRPRSTDPSVALSIAVPQSLKTRLDQELSYKQSRSRWVCGAIKAKLNDTKAFNLMEIDSVRLAWELRMREVISPGMFETIEKVIKAMSPVEETVKGQ